MAKKISIPTKPDTEQAEQWVHKEKTKAPTGNMKRLTLDIPEDLHRKIKLKAVQEGRTIADMLRAVLDAEYD